MDGLTDAIAIVAGFVILALVLRRLNDAGEPEPDHETTKPRLG